MDNENITVKPPSVSPVSGVQGNRRPGAEDRRFSDRGTSLKLGFPQYFDAIVTCGLGQTDLTAAAARAVLLIGA